METWIGISLVICSVALMRWMQARAVDAGRGAPGARQLAGLEARLEALERRLGDVQEVVLAIDEKLEQRDAVPGVRF